MKRCQQCGQPIDDRSSFCSRCGGKQHPHFAPGGQYSNGYQQPPLNNGNQGGGYRGNSLEDYYWRNDCFASCPEGKSRGVTGLLAIFLGGLGVQYFYLGKVGGGLITILLSLVTCGLWDILTFIQGIVILCMDNRSFREKFVVSNSTLPLF